MKLNSILLLACVAALLALTPTIHLAEDAPAVAKPNAEHRSEGEQLLGSMRDRCRVQYSKTGTAPGKLVGKDDGVGAAADELKGKHFSVTDKVYVVGKKGDRAALTAEPVKASDGYGILIFYWANGNSEISWYDDFDKLKAAQKDIEFDDKEETTGEPEVDGYALYKKEGRSWMHKTVSKFGDMDEIVSYMKYEITKVTADSATLKSTFLDAEKKQNQYVQPSETEIKFTKAIADPGAPKVELEEVEIEVLGKKWKAWLVTNEVNGMTSKSWSSKEFPGLLLKMENSGETAGMKMNTTMELVEWNE